MITKGEIIVLDKVVNLINYVNQVTIIKNDSGEDIDVRFHLPK